MADADQLERGINPIRGMDEPRNVRMGSVAAGQCTHPM
ncbi:hypothetical protein SynBOUM118_01646 [Synechococcus sp. BOUM118]|nr:hypothetical protein SynRS9915_01741 [Synechococcus sp. RS9915]QNI92006.1 hypothetical protein SynBOUM118_01646 [Synechococcus sp. BOUM118]